MEEYYNQKDRRCNTKRITDTETECYVLRMSCESLSRPCNTCPSMSCPAFFAVKSRSPILAVNVGQRPPLA